MPVIDYPRPEGSGLIWGCDFQNRMMVQSQGGIIVGSTIGNGISPTAASSRVTFKGTESVAVNATQMTIVMLMNIPAAWRAGVNNTVLAKTASALNDNQWMIETQVSGNLFAFIASSAADASNYFYSLLPTGPVRCHCAVVYDGSLAAASRVKFYINGATNAVGFSGTVPARMIASAQPITSLNRASGTLLAPPTDFILRSARIYNRAWGLAEVQDDYANQTYSEIYS